MADRPIHEVRLRRKLDPDYRVCGVAERAAEGGRFVRCKRATAFLYESEDGRSRMWNCAGHDPKWDDSARHIRLAKRTYTRRIRVFAGTRITTPRAPRRGGKGEK